MAPDDISEPTWTRTLVIMFAWKCLRFLLWTAVTICLTIIGAWLYDLLKGSLSSSNLLPAKTMADSAVGFRQAHSLLEIKTQGEGSFVHQKENEKFNSQFTMVNSPSRSHSDLQLAQAHEPESQLSSLIYDMSQQVQMAVEKACLRWSMKLIRTWLETGVVEDIEKCKYSALERKKVLEEEKEQFQKAAYTIIDMLNYSV